MSSQNLVEESPENILHRFEDLYFKELLSTSNSDNSNTNTSSPSTKKMEKGQQKTDNELQFENGKQIMEDLKINVEKANQSSSVSLQMFKDIKSNSKLKVIEAAVPNGILPSGYSAVLYDVRIATHGPDEKIYRSHKWIRENVTRGLTFMGVVGNEKWFDFAIYSNKKFTGGVGDEDESQPENNDVWREFCLQPPEEATQAICMTKLNGEAGHFAVRKIGNEYYIIAGSKNVHLLCKNYEDVEKYNESRYLVARTVATAVLNVLNTMEVSKCNCFKQLLHVTKMTVVCEVLQPHYQHIVNLSDLKESTVHLLMLTSVASAGETESFTALSPHLALAIGKFFDIPTPDYYSLTVSELNDRIIELRGARNSEGFVVYYLQDGRTIGLAKLKTVWYVMLRALREKVDYAFNGKKQKEANLEDRIKAMRKRFSQIQRWLKFTNNYLRCWEKLGEAYFLWLSENIQKGKLYSKNIRPKFPVIWNNFLSDTGRTDNFKLEVT